MGMERRSEKNLNQIQKAEKFFNKASPEEWYKFEVTFGNLSKVIKDFLSRQDSPGGEDRR